MTELKDVPKIVILFVLIALTITLSAAILYQYKVSPQNVGTGSRLDSNTVTFYNGSYATVVFGDYDSKGNAALGCSNVNIYNGTNNLNWTGFFTISGCSAYTSNNTNNNTAQTVNYTLSFQTYLYGYNITEQGESAQSNLSGWQNIWAVISAAAIVLALIGGYLYFKV